MKPLVFFPILVFLKFVHIAASEPSYVFTHCIETAGNHTENSQYTTNLNNVFKKLVSESKKSDFVSKSSGQGNDQVFGLFLCRYGVDLHSCHDCVQHATEKVLDKCPQWNEAVIIHLECTVRYANRNFSTDPVHPNDKDTWAHWNNTVKTTDPARLKDVLPGALKSIMNEAAFEEPYRGYATKEVNFSHGLTLYCLAQCTPDIPGHRCDVCLEFAYREIWGSCCEDYEGVAIFRASCMLRYECDTAPFYQLLPPPQTPQPDPGDPLENSSVVYYIIRVGIPVAGFILLFSCAIVAFCIHKKKKNHQRIEKDTEILESLQFKVESLKLATKDFSDDYTLGRGGFGIVYKGVLPQGKEVAVKRLMKKDLGRGGDEQFKNEILILAKLQHRNLVTLLGFCLEEDEMLLVYEFMPNNSLDKFLFDPEKRRAYMSWETCFKIIDGIVKGLVYLHEQSRIRIIHRDLKAANVLLDEDFNPKISDFGMARLFNIDQTQTMASKIVGTFGYMAPEYVLQGQISTKLDVYSFGILVLEIIIGRKINSIQIEADRETFLEFVWKNWIEGTALNVVEPSLSNASSTEILRCIHVGLLCVQQNPQDRPAMALVDLMLRSGPVAFPIPSKPAFFEQRDEQHDHVPPQSSSSNTSGSTQLKFSSNEVSITEFHPR